VPEGDPDSDPEEQWDQPRNDVYIDDAGLLRSPDGRVHLGDIYNTDGPVERTMYENDDYEDMSSVE